MAKPETLPYCQGLSLWERWHGVSRDGEGKPASKRQIYEKALVFQGENLERREPVKFKLQGTRGTTLFAAPLGTAALHDRLFAANRCPCNGGHPSEPTCVFSPAAQGPVTETLCTRLAPPGGSLYAEENRFFPVNAFVLFSKWTKFSMLSRTCQEDWLIGRMKQIHINSLFPICLPCLRPSLWRSPPPCCCGRTKTPRAISTSTTTKSNCVLYTRTLVPPA